MIVTTAITAMYVGTSAVTALYAGADKVWPTSPYEYCNYIYCETANTGNLYFDYTPTIDTKILLKGVGTNYTTGSWFGNVGSIRLQGYRVNRAYYYWYFNNSSYLRIQFQPTAAGTELGTYFELEMGNNYLTNRVNGFTQSGNKQITIGGTQIYVRLGNVNTYGIEIYEGDTQIANLLPAKRIEDGAYGLYDTIRDTFYTDTYVKGA